MKILVNNSLNVRKVEKLFTRPAINNENAAAVTKKIISDVKRNGDKAVLKYAKLLDDFNGSELRINLEEINNSNKSVSKELKSALRTAYRNIYKFHKPQLPLPYSVDTMKGVRCSRRYLPIENVGIYIPGGNAVLVSTILMLAIPAKIAGCKRVVLCTPPGPGGVSKEVLYTAQLCGVNEVYAVGGAQAIAMMAYGTRKIPKVDKIFGPGNQYVTSAKTMVSIDPDGCAIDMPAGPSEVLVIADGSADPKFVAADLLSQAEHGYDSQVILLTTSKQLAGKVNKEIQMMLTLLPRKAFAESTLKNSFALIVKSIDEAIHLSNKYAPEHLILNMRNASKYKHKIVNAGSVFIGPYSPESAGDYASGTNHSLPTYGYAKTSGGVSVESFMKSITFQELTFNGLKEISNTIIKLAETEKLDAHANAVRVRIKNGY